MATPSPAKGAEPTALQLLLDAEYFARSRTSGEHPLQPTLRLARLCHQWICDEIKDYTCVLVKRERVNGVLLEPETLFAKVRHEEDESENESSRFSVYMKFNSPSTVQGREILFRNREDDNRILVRKGGKRLPFLTVRLDPKDPFAMQGNRYAITEFGIKRLIERMMDLGEKELAYDECEVRIDADHRFEDRPCTRIEVCHPVQRDHFRYHLVRIYIDNELQLPFRFESYDWPEEENLAPVLDEEYTYRELRLNVNLTEEDFAKDNPEYRFSIRD